MALRRNRGAGRLLAAAILVAACFRPAPLAAEGKAGGGASVRGPRSEEHPSDAGLIRVFGADEAEGGPKEPAARSRYSPLSTLARTGFWLGLVIAMLCGLVVLARKFMPKCMGQFRSPGVEMLGRTYLDPKRCVYLLKVGGRCLVVGSSEGGLARLGEISEREEVEHLACLARSGARQPSSGGSGFAGALSRRVTRLAELVRGRGEQVGDSDEWLTDGDQCPECGGESLQTPGDGLQTEKNGLETLREQVERLKHIS